MKKKLRNSIVVGILLLILLLIVVIVINKNKKPKEFEEINEDLTNPNLVVPEEKSANESSMSIDEIKEIISSKTKELSDYLYQSKVYYASEIKPESYKPEDDNINYVYEETFLTNLKRMLSKELYEEISEKLIFLAERRGTKYYIVEASYMKNLIYNSAITTKNIVSKENKLELATDEKIKVNSTLNICNQETDEDDDYCLSNYSLELIVEDGEWKINVF